jgi:hypothetical protein
MKTLHSLKNPNKINIPLRARKEIEGIYHSFDGGSPYTDVGFKLRLRISGSYHIYMRNHITSPWYEVDRFDLNYYNGYGRNTRRPFSMSMLTELEVIP